MPTYQYECSNCGHDFEILQSMTENRLRKCPQCSKFTLTRLIGTGSGIIFKGSGFYETDYKRKEPARAESKSKPEASKDAANAPSDSKSHGCSSSCGCSH